MLKMNTSSSLSLTFDSIQMRAVSVPLRNPIVSKVGHFTQWPFILIDVRTSEGVTGHSYLEPYVEKAIPAICSMIQVLADHFKGKPLAPLDIYSDSMKMFHLVGREGISLIAMAGLDIAVWDALARAVNLPLVGLLGGQPGKIRAYNTNGLWLIPIEELGNQAKKLVAQGGFKALKLRLGRNTANEDIRAIRAVREAVGEDILLMTDFNQGMTYGEALQRMHQLDDQGLYWFEEPITYDNTAGYSKITSQIKTPVQVGENIYGPREFYKSVKAGAADLYMPDLMRIGGVTGWMRAAAIAGAAGCPLSSHLYPVVSSHLLRVSETADWLEWSDWSEPILNEPFEIQNGFATVTDKPGNGLAWNEAAVKKYSI
jgi:mandelate racemase